MLRLIMGEVNLSGRVLINFLIIRLDKMSLLLLLKLNSPFSLSLTSHFPALLPTILSGKP